MGRRLVVNVSAQSFERATHNEATEVVSLSTGAQLRECKRSSAPGEVSVNVLSDAGSTPAISTIKETSFVYQDKRGFFD